MHAAALLLTFALAAPPADKPAAAPAPPAVELLHTEADAVGWAFDALMNAYTEADWPYIRFAYLPPWADAEWVGAVNFAVNASASHNRSLVPGRIFAGGYLIGYDLRVLAGTVSRLPELTATWDELAVREARFHIPDLNIPDAGKGSRPVAFLAPHLATALAKHATDAAQDQRIDVLVTQMTKSAGAIYPADFLIEQLLTSIRGKYPEFRQIRFTVSKGRPLDAHLLSRGFSIDNSQRVGEDLCAFIMQSNVTGKQRVVMAIYGRSGSPCTITLDFADDSIRADEQFVRNLLEFTSLADALEIFIPLPNGLLEFVLANGDGDIQRVAPPNVVADDTKPTGHTKELEMGMSCVVCHAPADGYKPFQNDLEALLGSDTDLFGDVATIGYTTRWGEKRTLTRDEALNIVNGRFAEPLDEPDGIIGRARRDYIKTVGLLTDYDVTSDGPSAVELLGLKIKEIYHGYRYATIDADRACLELGVRVPAGTGRTNLAKLLPSLPKGSQEDIVITLLKQGVAIQRDQMDAIHVELARRAIDTRPTLFEQVEASHAN